MESLYNFINNIFKRLFSNNHPSDTGLIEVSNSTNVNIFQNEVNPSYYYYFNISDSNTESELFPIKGLMYEEAIVNSSLERAEKNNDYFEQFIFYSNLRGITPTVRCYAFFSHLSSIRKRSDMNEYNQLILSERDLFHRMMELKFHVKLIISLDIPTILSKWYNDLSSAIDRITDLIENIDIVCENNNIEVVIDEMNSMDGQFILHNSLFIHALNADPTSGYNITKYETDVSVVNNAIRLFDQRFCYLKMANQNVKRHMQTTSMSMFIKHTLDIRIEEWNRKLNNS